MEKEVHLVDRASVRAPDCCLKYAHKRMLMEKEVHLVDRASVRAPDCCPKYAHK